MTVRNEDPNRPQSEAVPTPGVESLPLPQRPLAERLLGLAMWVPGLTWMTGMMGVMMIAQRLFPPDQVDFLARWYTRGQVRASGSRLFHHVHPEVDPEGVYMFVQNHVNMMDHCTCYNATPHFKQGIELASHFKIPVYGWYMKGRGTIPVRGEGSPKQAYKELRDRIRSEVERGHSLLVFPEGTRTLDGRVGPFQPGLFRIAIELGVPIVPIAVTGMFEVMRKGEPYINPGHDVHVFVEKPIATRGMKKTEVKGLVEQVRDVIIERVDAHYAAEPRRRRPARLVEET